MTEREDAEFRKHLQRRHCLWLPVSLPVPSPPADVALWLFELRHASDSSEILDSLRLDVECASVASEVWLLSGDEDDSDVSCASESHKCQTETLKQNRPDPNAMQWALNPVYSGERLDGIQRNERQEEEEEEGRGAATATITGFRKLCNTVLAELDNIRNIGGNSLATPTTSSPLLLNGSETNESVIKTAINDRQENDSTGNLGSGNDEEPVLAADKPNLSVVCHTIQTLHTMDEKCEEVLKDLDDIIQSLGVDSDDSYVDYEMEPDKEFLELCQKADDLAEESIEDYLAKPKIYPKEVEKIKKTRSITLSSDLSDDVFVSSPGNEKPHLVSPLSNECRRHHSLDINNIFDDGVTPPVPPARKKKNKERRKTIEVDRKVSEKCTANVSLLSESVVIENKANTSQSQAEDFKMLHIGAEQSQELLLLEKATESTKERRHARTTSFYEDADACCCKDVHNETSPSLCIPHHSPDYIDSSPLSITLTQIRPISFMEFPPKSPVVEVLSVSCEEETLHSGNSVLDSSQCRSRKGSISSDILAWKQELRRSAYLDEESDDDDPLMLSNEWYSSNDSEGRVYFFQENGHESSWVLPEISVTPSQIEPCPEVPAPSPPASSQASAPEGKKKSIKRKQGDDVMLRSSGHFELDGDNQSRMAKAHSMVLVDPRGEKQTAGKSSTFPRNWPELWDGNMCVLKEGTLNRTKITENGRKLRKNWAPAHVVLTELFLLFFKDAKSFAAMKTAQGDDCSEAMRPELSVDLNGALLERGSKVSSRRNVFLVSTVLGLQVLVQCDNAVLAEEWYQAIQKAIKDLPSGYNMRPMGKFSQLSPQHLGSASPDETKKSLQIGRSRSLKVKSSTKEESQEDLATSGENPTKIKARLKKFFHRRPTKESLVKKGIYRDEPVFGCHLPDICGSEPPRIPLFVQRCVAAIESKEENMKTDGLYRASGNLSQVQKIRLQIDQNNLSILEQEEDVHVLTGALKLFFRELKKPLIPFEYFNKALQASTNPNKKEKIQQFREIVKALPVCNRETLDFLLKHLLRVTCYQEFNRMHIPNLAIVFGPTLMWPEAESVNMALDLMQQNLVIECFLQEYDNIFR